MANGKKPQKKKGIFEMLGERVSKPAIKEVVRSGVERKLSEGDIYRAAKRSARIKELELKGKRDAKAGVNKGKGSSIFGKVGSGAATSVNVMLGVPVNPVVAIKQTSTKKKKRSREKTVLVRVPVSQLKGKKGRG